VKRLALDDLIRICLHCWLISFHSGIRRYDCAAFSCGP